MRPWWERWPEAAEAERAALRAANIPFDEEVLAPHDGAPRLRMTLWPHVGADSMRLVADYPETFPYFPPQVAAPDKVLTRHQHPAGGVLCLLADEGDWRVGDTLAELIEAAWGIC